MIPNSELILNPNRSVYHLKLLPEQVSNTIITVGDPERVNEVTKHFDDIEFSIQNREFKTSTGTLSGKRLTVISTGIGTDNIDIVLNELDALHNIDLSNRTIKEKLTTLEIFRIGTSGTMREDIAVDSYVSSSFAIGLDGLGLFYNNSDVHSGLTQEVDLILQNMGITMPAYVGHSDESLLLKFDDFCRRGITLTAAGFYGPQGRKLRLQPKSTDYITNLGKIEFQNLVATNFEMETAGIYFLSNLLGHKAISLNAIIANRITGEFSAKIQNTVENLISKSLERIVG